MLLQFKDIAVQGDRIFWTVTLKSPHHSNVHPVTLKLSLTSDPAFFPA